MSGYYCVNDICQTCMSLKTLILMDKEILNKHKLLLSVRLGQEEIHLIQSLFGGFEHPANFCH